MLAPKNQLVTGVIKKTNPNVNRRLNRNGNREEITRFFVVEMKRAEMIDQCIVPVEMTDDLEITDAMTDVMIAAMMIAAMMIVAVVIDAMIDAMIDVMIDEAAEIEMRELVLGENRMIPVKLHEAVVRLREAVARLHEAVARLREAVAKSHEAIALHNLLVVGAMLLHHVRLMKSNVPKKLQLKQKRHQVHFEDNSFDNHLNLNTHVKFHDSNFRTR